MELSFLPFLRVFFAAFFLVFFTWCLPLVDLPYGAGRTLMGPSCARVRGKSSGRRSDGTPPFAPVELFNGALHGLRYSCCLRYLR